MNTNILNAKIVEAIKDKLPQGANIIHFLTDTLYLGKEAIYRRLRGDVPFSFHEVYTIVQKLDISLDYILNYSTENNIIFELRQHSYYDPKDVDYAIFLKFLDILRNVSQESVSELAVSYNVFPQLPIQLYYNLSRYNSFKWIYQNQNLYPIRKFEEVELPRRLYEIHKDTILESMKIKHTSYIWDYTIIETLVKEIKYFENIELIDKEDVLKLKEELYDFLNYVEKLAITGEFENGNRFDLYISCIHSDTAYLYIETPNTQISMLGAFGSNHMISKDLRALTRMKGKILSRKRVATLISRSDEMYRISFFRKQRELLETLN